jgi:hypothetical protein
MKLRDHEASYLLCPHYLTVALKSYVGSCVHHGGKSHQHPSSWSGIPASRRMKPGQAEPECRWSTHHNLRCP